jgi:hypothetical protein
MYDLNVNEWNNALGFKLGDTVVHITDEQKEGIVIEVDDSLHPVLVEFKDNSKSYVLRFSHMGHSQVTNKIELLRLYHVGDQVKINSNLGPEYFTVTTLEGGLQITSVTGETIGAYSRDGVSWWDNKGQYRLNLRIKKLRP